MKCKELRLGTSRTELEQFGFQRTKLLSRNTNLSKFIGAAVGSWEGSELADIGSQLLGSIAQGLQSFICD